MLARHWLFAAAAHGHKDALDHVNWAGAKRPRVDPLVFRRLDLVLFSDPEKMTCCSSVA